MIAVFSFLLHEDQLTIEIIDNRDILIEKDKEQDKKLERDMIA